MEQDTDPDPKARDIFTFIINDLNTCSTLPAIYEYLIFIVNNWTSIKLDLKVNITNMYNIFKIAAHI